MPKLEVLLEFITTYYLLLCLFCFLFVLILLYVWIANIRTHQLLIEVFKWNKALNRPIPMGVRVGWRDAEIKPVIIPTGRRQRRRDKKQN